MRSARVTFELPDGRRVRCGAGALVGRLPSATVHWSDPELSEARALVSLRAGSLWLLGLRGPLGVGGERPRDVRLEEGLDIQLSARFSLRVVEVEVPDEIWALRGPVTLPVVVDVGSVVEGPPPSLVPGLAEGALARIWTGGDETWLRTREGEEEVLAVGQLWRLGAERYEVVLLPTETAAARPTSDRGRLSAPLTIRHRPDEAVVESATGERLLLTEKEGQLVHVLATAPHALSRDEAAQRVWRLAYRSLRDPGDSFDSLRYAVCRRLRSAGLRSYLFEKTPKGWKLHVEPGDRVEALAPSGR